MLSHIKIYPLESEVANKSLEFKKELLNKPKTSNFDYHNVHCIRVHCDINIKNEYFCEQFEIEINGLYGKCFEKTTHPRPFPWNGREINVLIFKVFGWDHHSKKWCLLTIDVSTHHPPKPKTLPAFTIGSPDIMIA